MSRIIFLLVFCLFLIGCNTPATVVPTSTIVVTEMPAFPSPTNTPISPTNTPIPPTKTPIPPTNTPEPTVTLPSVIIEDNIRIEGVDGFTLRATYYAGISEPPYPAVILLHMLNDSRQVWASNGFADLLVEHGYAVLAIDMRGHGGSDGAQNWRKARGDLVRSWNYLTSRPDIDPNRTAIVGGSIGANMALVVGSRKEEVRTVIMLSGGFDFAGISPQEDLAEYGNRPLLLVASENDGDLVANAQTLASQATGETETIIYEQAGHGTDMFTAEPDLAGLLVAWLDEFVKPNE